METPTSRSTNRRRWTHFAGTGAVALVAATRIVSAAGAATTPANAPIGATGSVAAMTGSTMEVQNPSSGQTTVNWTSTTTFSKSVTEAVSSLTVGTCVTVTGTPSKSSKTTIAARSISVAADSSTGSCTGRFRPGGRGGRRRRARRRLPFRRTRRVARRAAHARPSIRGRADGFPGSRPIAIATGKVTAVSGSTLSVSGYDLSPGSFARPKSSKSTIEDEEADHAQDGEPQDHDHDATTVGCDPDCRGDGPGRR